MSGDELEDYWDAIVPQSPIRIVNPAGSNLQGQLSLACEKAVFDLAAKFHDQTGAAVTPTMMGEMVAQGVRFFMKHWLDGLRSQNLAGLIEIVLEGQELTPDEMVQFVRALPTSLLTKIASSGLGSANGIHGLIGIESARRRGEVSKYTLGRDLGCGGRVFVKFATSEGVESQFFLDESFQVPE